MKTASKISLAALASLTLIAGLGAYEFQRNAAPIVRDVVSAPIYTIGEVEGYNGALASGKNVVKFGPMFFGLYPGGLAFKNAENARSYIKDKRLDEKVWSVYSLSGDYDLDALDGYINKSLLVQKEKTAEN